MPLYLSNLKRTPSALTEAYGVLGVPHSLLIDENGNLTAVKVNGQVLEMILNRRWVMVNSSELG